MEKQQALLRKLPKMDELLLEKELVLFLRHTPRSVVVEAAREELEGLRQEILAGKRTALPETAALVETVSSRIRQKKKRHLRPLINATGVVLHTNFGRARLSETATAAAEEAAGHYTNLEYTVKTGARGERNHHVEGLLTTITGAEAAMVVNNNAAATMLGLSCVAAGKEVVVSRGELVEIGGSFRLPEIMEQSGVTLREVGTTNRTRLRDYRCAYDSEATGAFLKVHTSNYRIVGFAGEVSIKELAALGKEVGLPVLYDSGGGLLVNLSRWGVAEPTVGAAIKDGADVVFFSADKLLGGPQAGILVGKRRYVESMRHHPLARVFRVDKMTLAALEATLFEYLDPETARERIPVLQSITVPQAALLQRAKALSAAILEEAGGAVSAEVKPCADAIGGGTAPATELPGAAVVLDGAFSAEQLERQLRKAEVPVIARTSHGRVFLSVRTITEEELSETACAVAKAALLASEAAAQKGNGESGRPAGGGTA